MQNYQFPQTLTEILEFLIKSRFKNIKNFSNKSGLPYMTISNVLKRGVENSTFGTISKICNALDIDLDYLLQIQKYGYINNRIKQLGDAYNDDALLNDLLNLKILKKSQLSKLSLDYDIRKNQISNFVKYHREISTFLDDFFTDYQNTISNENF